MRATTRSNGGHIVERARRRTAEDPSRRDVIKERWVCEESIGKVVGREEKNNVEHWAWSVEPVHPSDQARPARGRLNSRPAAEAKKEPRVASVD